MLYRSHRCLNVLEENSLLVKLTAVHATTPLLHIDDSAPERLLVKEAIALTNSPFLLFQADGLDAALEYFQADDATHPPPALVLLDYDLGAGHTGCTFLYWFRLVKKNHTTPVVMFSGSSGRRNVAESYAAGANHFLLKPHKMERFKAIVSTLFTSLAEPGAILLLPERMPDPRQKTGTARR
jgi:DNA-binding response OmpR family regulator